MKQQSRNNLTLHAFELSADLGELNSYFAFFLPKATLRQGMEFQRIRLEEMGSLKYRSTLLNVPCYFESVNDKRTY